MMGSIPIVEWTVEETRQWLLEEAFDAHVADTLCDTHRMTGKCLLALNEHDFNQEPLNQFLLGDRKRLFLLVRGLQRDHRAVIEDLGLLDPYAASTSSTAHPVHYLRLHDGSEYCESERVSPPLSDDGKGYGPAHQHQPRLPPEIGKAFLSFCYAVMVTWITAFVMVIVHDRVPDMKKYPPLPDIFLDNVPHIPWAFNMCEITGTTLMIIWLVVLVFHKHRFILMRRFFALCGTVFLLRCVTMLITSLSVPGAHLQCEPKNYTAGDDWPAKVSHAYAIWSGAGMSIQGVRTCGDYMFSGHTVALTMFNFFITEYTPHYLYFLHTVTWMMNMFGIFFILAAHEHYSIDVFVAFYITSRLFLYYHTLSNNQALVQRDYRRTRIWFPLFTYFESSVDGIVPNEYDTLKEIGENAWTFLKSLVQSASQYQCMLSQSTPKKSTSSVPSRRSTTDIGMCPSSANGFIESDKDK